MWNFAAIKKKVVYLLAYLLTYGGRYAYLLTCLLTYLLMVADMLAYILTYLWWGYPEDDFLFLTRKNLPENYFLFKIRKTTPRILLTF